MAVVVFVQGRSLDAAVAAAVAAAVMLALLLSATTLPAAGQEDTTALPMTTEDLPSYTLNVPVLPGKENDPTMPASILGSLYEGIRAFPSTTAFEGIPNQAVLTGFEMRILNPDLQDFDETLSLVVRGATSTSFDTNTHTLTVAGDLKVTTYAQLIKKVSFSMAPKDPTAAPVRADGTREVQIDIFSDTHGDASTRFNISISAAPYPVPFSVELAAASNVTFEYGTVTDSHVLLFPRRTENGSVTPSITVNFPADVFTQGVDSLVSIGAAIESDRDSPAEELSVVQQQPGDNDALPITSRTDPSGLTLLVTFTTSPSPEEAEESFSRAFAAFVYTNTRSYPTKGERVLHYEVTTAEGGVVFFTQRLHVTYAPDVSPPTTTAPSDVFSLDVLGDDVVVGQEDGSFFIDQMVSITVPSNMQDEIGFLRVIINNHLDGLHERLFPSFLPNGLSFTYVQVTGRLDISGTAGAAVYEQVLAHLKYVNVAAMPDLTTRTITIILFLAETNEPTQQQIEIDLFMDTTFRPTSDVSTTDPDPCGCENGGTCVTVAAESSQCDCPIGFAGDMCTVSVPICASQPCLASATCVDEVVSSSRHYSCQCADGRASNTCDTTVDNSTQGDSSGVPIWVVIVIICVAVVVILLLVYGLVRRRLILARKARFSKAADSSLRGNLLSNSGSHEGSRSSQRHDFMELSSPLSKQTTQNLTFKSETLSSPLDVDIDSDEETAHDASEI